MSTEIDIQVLRSEIKKGLQVMERLAEYLQNMRMSMLWEKARASPRPWWSPSAFPITTPARRHCFCEFPGFLRIIFHQIDGIRLSSKKCAWK